MASPTPSFRQFPPPAHVADVSESILTDMSNGDSKELGLIHPNDEFWTKYIDYAKPFDEGIIDGWNKIVDVTLIFVGLMISVLASFILDSYQQFKRDPVDISNDLLFALFEQLVAMHDNGTSYVLDRDTLFNQDTNDYKNAVMNNAFLYSSLGLCAAASLIALAAKLWLISYGQHVSSAGTAHYRAVRRQKAYSGVLAWKMGAVIQSLPLVLLLALVMFMSFIYKTIWSTQKDIGYAVGALLGTSVQTLATVSLAAAFIPSCPFHSTFSTIIRLIFELTHKVTDRLHSGVRFLLFTILWFGSGAVIGWATITHSSNYFWLVHIPLSFTIAHSMGGKEDQAKRNKPQAYRLPLLTLGTILFIGLHLAAAGFFCHPGYQRYRIFVGLYVIGMLILYGYGFVARRMSKSMDRTAEIDAMIWFLTSASTPDPELYKKASLMASNPGGRDYRAKLLESLMPLLSALITSTEVETQDLEIYVSCLALLSDFEPYRGDWWLLKEDARSHPELGYTLRNTLEKLANDHSSSVGVAANQILKFYPKYQEYQKHPELHKRQTSGESASVMTYVESVHSYEETELHSRRKNGYSRVESV